MTRARVERIGSMTGLALLTALGAVGTAAAGDDGHAAARTFQASRPSLVALDYSVRHDAGTFAASAAGLIVRADGLVMAAIDYFPERVQDSDFQNIEISMEAKDGELPEVFEGVFLGRDRVARAAFLKITGADKPFPTVAFDTRTDLRLGDRVVLVGFLPDSLGRGRFFTLGRITSTFTRPRQQYGLSIELMPGAMPAPGTPVYSIDGRALGVLGSLSVDEGNDRGRAVSTLWPATNFEDALRQPPDAAQEAKAPWIGIIGMQDVDRDLAEYWKLPAPGGVLVGHVIPGSPAEEAGLSAEDVVLGVAGKPVHTRVGSSVQYLIDLVRRQKIGTNLPVRAWRAGNVTTYEILLRERPKEASQAERFRIEGEFRFTVRELVFLDLFGRDLPVEQTGVVVSFTQPGWAVDGGLLTNDVITKVDSDPVTGFESFRKLWESKIEGKPREIVLTVIRGETNQTVLVRVECVWGR